MAAFSGPNLVFTECSHLHIYVSVKLCVFVPQRRILIPMLHDSWGSVSASVTINQEIFRKITEDCYRHVIHRRRWVMPLVTLLIIKKWWVTLLLHGSSRWVEFRILKHRKKFSLCVTCIFLGTVILEPHIKNLRLW